LEDNNPNFDTNAYSSMLDVNAFETQNHTAELKQHLSLSPIKTPD